ncbi:MAG: hypothetical protein KDB03_06015 [Planctomycetales bacterium]|nr:hypothetical protein [Planctomycetales bacterium]
MILSPQDVVLVSNRRMFPNDETRYFLGRVLASEDTLVKIEGYSFVRDLANGHVIKKDERRVKILSLASPGFLVYQLPSELQVDAAHIESQNGDAILVDDHGEWMNLAEHTHCGHF